MKNRKNFDSNLYLMAGFLFLIAGLIQSMTTFYVIACVMFVLSITGRNKKK